MKITRCNICNIDLSLWGPDRKGLCPDCSSAMREIMVPCGRSNNLYPMGRMEKMSLFFSPGKSGGKKFSLLYCADCLSQTMARAKKVSEIQKKSIKSSEKELSRRAS